MSYFPSIRPSLLNKKWIIQETKINRIEIVRNKEQALLQKFKLISKQGKPTSVYAAWSSDKPISQ